MDTTELVRFFVHSIRTNEWSFSLEYRLEPESFSDRRDTLTAEMKGQAA